MEIDISKEQIIEDNAYFKKALDLIPLDFYFPKETNQVEVQSEKTENKGSEKGAESLSDRALWKRKRYDPSQIRTVSQVMEAEELEESKPKKHLKPGSVADGDVGLQKRLHTIIKDKKAKRGSSKKDGNQDKKARRRASKLKLKQKKQAEKQGKAKLTNGQTSNIDGKSPANRKSPAKKPIYNSNGKMVFSKFDFTDSGTKNKSDAPTGKNYKRLLEIAQRKKEKIDKLKETDESKAKELSAKSQWKNVLQRAEGVKVKDDPELLKKALKKKEKRKDKKKEAWSERAQKVKDQMKGKQDKRKMNIGKRKQGRVDKKIQKAKKKGRIIPGF